MGIFTEYLTANFVNIAPTHDTPLTLLPADANNPIIINAIIVTNIGVKQPIRVTVEGWYLNPITNIPVSTGYIAYELLVPSLNSETENHLRTCNILQRIGVDNLHLAPSYFLTCFVQGPTQKCDLRMEYTLLKNL